MARARSRFPLLLVGALAGLLVVSCAAPSAPPPAPTNAPAAPAAAAPTKAPEAPAAPKPTAAPAAPAAAAAAEKVTLRFGHHFPTDNSWAKAIDSFAAIVAQKSGGKLEIKIFPNSQLGNEREAEEGLQLGNLDFTLGGPGVLTNFDPKIGVLDLPFLFTSYAHANKVMDGPIGGEIWDSMRAKAGIRVLASGAQGSRFVLTKTKPIAKLEDFKGVKIRTPEAQTYLRTFQLLGANPVAVAWGETYTALQTGVVDGMEGVPEIMLTAKMFEVGKNVARTNHIMATLQLLVSDKTYQKLSPENQKIVSDAAKEAWGAARTAAEKANKDAEGELDKQGVKFTNPDAAELAKAVSPFLEEWGQKNGALDWVKKIPAAQ